MRPIARAPWLLGLFLVLTADGAPGQEPFSPPPRSADAVRVLLVTGGHDHDVSFYSVLDGYEDIATLVDSHGALARSLEGTDVVVLYDMPAEMTPEQRDGLEGFVEGGGGSSPFTTRSPGERGCAGGGKRCSEGAT